MVIEKNLSYLFKDLNYVKYFKSNKINEIFEIKSVKKNDFKNLTHHPYYSVDPKNDTPYELEIGDLTRLHYLVRSRKVCTILEFGVGFSTKIFDHALSINKNKFQMKFKKFRKSHQFECHSVDNYKSWITKFKKNFKTNNVKLHHSNIFMSTFNDRICTYYKKLPNISPNLIYIDAPDQFSVLGSIRGISTKNPDRFPMVGDILAMEYFLNPRTLIVLDGRTANARFLKNNLQRNWHYQHFEEFDQHIFELFEKPLGVFNKDYINFCLDKNFN